MTEPGPATGAAVAALMGVNPADAAAVLKTLLDVWDLAAERMIEAVARRLARGITEDGWAERKGREVLAVRDELLAIVQRLDTDTPGMARRALEEAYDLGRRAATTLDVSSIRTRTDEVLTLAQRYVGQLRGTFVPVLRAELDLYQRAVVETELLMQTGTMVRREAVAQVVDRLQAQGRDRFLDDQGRRWHLDTYARMAGRTVAGHAAVQGQLDRMVVEGRDLVVISDSPRECPMCRPWEGKLLSISGGRVGERVDGHRVVAPLAEARAAGLWHPNCTHRADPYAAGLTRVPKADANPEGYEQQQKLRQLERRARELKRRLTAAEQFGRDNATARKLRKEIRDNSAAIKAHTESTGQLRRRDRERPVDDTRPPEPPRDRDEPPAPPPPPPEPERDEPRRPLIDDLIPRESPDDAERDRIREDVYSVFEDQEFGDFLVDINEVRFSTNKLIIGGNIHHTDGMQAGYVVRGFYREDDGTLWVDHNYLELEPEYQGQGFATAFNGFLYDWYRESGVEYVEVHADIDVGGYTWARQGFDFADAEAAETIIDLLEYELRDLHRSMDDITVQLGEHVDGPRRQQLEQLRDRARHEIAAAEAILDRAYTYPFGSDEYPTAYEISQAGRTDGSDDWIGKRAMLGSDWQGRRWL
ncbi:phage minor capsid protein [Amycolatopsis thermophila]|uniref:GNAT superfamily N-acetyltransferase n=1 Tax=Amycolatopsis thermophila TaxID=206084 RepID=A0ABU0ET10_9PSEU|nr:phage minor capsid protein [Amycolatopsis thermophila]MDQ0377947.1 GNAT superfamily N-acetyltransferase [Amycolatopsis thermophila]